jgi:phosphoenolpyruvate-protein kinase (PTS system EI component)
VVKQAIRAHGLEECRKLARKVLACRSCAEIRRCLSEARARLLAVETDQ